VRRTGDGYIRYRRRFGGQGMSGETGGREVAPQSKETPLSGGGGCCKSLWGEGGEVSGARICFINRECLRSQSGGPEIREIPWTSERNYLWGTMTERGIRTEMPARLGSGAGPRFRGVWFGPSQRRR